MPYTPHSCYEFGPYRLNPAERLLTRDGETIALTPKAADILTLLVTNAGCVVEKDDLLKEVWADTFVEDSNLAQNIFTLIACICFWSNVFTGSVNIEHCFSKNKN